MISIRPFVVRDSRDVVAESAQFTNGVIAAYSLLWLLPAVVFAVAFWFIWDVAT